jgi:hypothetical protein
MLIHEGSLYAKLVDIVTENSNKNFTIEIIIDKANHKVRRMTYNDMPEPVKNIVKMIMEKDIELVSMSDLLDYLCMRYGREITNRNPKYTSASIYNFLSFALSEIAKSKKKSSYV